MPLFHRSSLREERKARWADCWGERTGNSRCGGNMSPSALIATVWGRRVRWEVMQPWYAQREPTELTLPLHLWLLLPLNLSLRFPPCLLSLPPSLHTFPIHLPFPERFFFYFPTFFYISHSSVSTLLLLSTNHLSHHRIAQLCPLENRGSGQRSGCSKAIPEFEAQPGPGPSSLDS